MLRDHSAWFVVAGVYSGMLAVSCILFSIVWDLVAVTRGWTTVSAFLGECVSSRHPNWVLVLVGCLCFAIGCLVGHLFMTEK